MDKFREVTASGPKIIMANTLNFMPIFECSFKKNVGGGRPRNRRGVR